MFKNNTVNMKVVERVAKALGELNEQVVYVGGAVVGLYITDTGADLPRPTKDIDISVQVSTYPEMENLRETLASKGIYPKPGGTTYRYGLDDILIDFMPFESTQLGPSIKWLKPGFNKAYWVPIENEKVKILPVSLYLCTKWEAHKSRGGADPRQSHDFEDIIYILDNSDKVLADIETADSDVKLFLSDMAKEILNHPSRNEILECHIYHYFQDERIPWVIEKLENIQAIK